MPRRRTRKEQQAHTRSCLMSSAAKVFARRGLQQASIDEVAEDAGFTKGAFYANFKSKEELFLVMLDEKFAAEIERVDRILAGRDEPGEEARQATEDFIRFVNADPEWPRLSFEFTAYAARNDEFRQELATRNRALQRKLAEVYRRWSADFPFDPPIPIEDVSTITFCMTKGFVAEQLIEPELREEMAGTMMAIFFLGMQAAAAGWQPPPKVKASP
jgi:AcrR family transcriptional regulator